MEGQGNGDGARAERNVWIVDGELRAFWKLSAFFAVWVLAFFGILLATSFLALPLHNPHLQIGLFLAAVAIATAFGMLVVDRGAFPDIGFGRPNAGRHVTIGLVVSGGMIVCVVLAELATGSVDLRLSAVTIGRGAGILASGFGLYILVGFAEELLMRGYPFRTLLRSSNQATALLVTSILFSLIHVRNPGITLPALCNIFLAGIWLGKARLVSGRLWLPIGLHTGWNFVQGTVFGYPVSGIVEAGVLRAQGTGAVWLTGGYFGPEGGALASVVLLLGTLALWHPRVVALLEPERSRSTRGADGFPEEAGGGAGPVPALKEAEE